MVIEGHSSAWLNLTSRVPQGSSLGPLLFLIYIDDLPTSVACKSKLFADDAVLYQHITSLPNCEQFEGDLRSASDWCKRWLVTLKAEKCKTSHISRKKDPLLHQYSLDNTLLPSVDHHKHLGVWLESSLSWHHLCQLQQGFGSNKENFRALESSWYSDSL